MNFDGYNIRNYVDKINRIERQIGSSRAHTLVNIPGVAGAIIARSKTGVKPIPVKVQIFGSDKPTLRQKSDALADVLFTEKEAPLIFDDEPHKTYYAIVTDETPFDELAKHGSAEILFLCPDPYAFGDSKNTALSYNGSSDTTIGGNAPTLPVFTATFDGPSSYFEITTSHGQKMRVIYNFSISDTLIVDHYENLITINGVENNQILTLDSDLFSLPKGDVTIISSSETTGTLEMDYFERWR